MNQQTDAVPRSDALELKRRDAQYYEARPWEDPLRMQRLRDASVGGDGTPEPSKRKLTQMELFEAVVSDVDAKDDRHTMEHPLFAISKRKDIGIREYTDRRTGCRTRIIPSAQGLATIWDKDLLLFAISQLVAAKNRGETLRREMRVRSIGLLRATRRGDGAMQYKALRNALERLSGTQIVTEIETNGKRITKPFRWLDDWELISHRDGKVYEFAMQLPSWIFNAILGEEVLSISTDYFDLAGGLERRLYEIGRKHLGRQREWRVTLQRLHEKSGSTASLKRFRFELRLVVAAQPLPGLRVALTQDEGAEIAVFTHAAPAPRVPDVR